MRAIIADSGSLDQNLGLGGGVADGFNHGLARVDAAGIDALFAFLAPTAIAQIFTGKVDNDLGTVGKVSPTRGGGGVPFDLLDARWELQILTWVAGEQDYLVTVAG